MKSRSELQATGTRSPNKLKTVAQGGSEPQVETRQDAGQGDWVKRTASSVVNSFKFAFVFNQVKTDYI